MKDPLNKIRKYDQRLAIESIYYTANMVTKSGSLHANYKNAICGSRKVDNKIYPIQWVSKGRTLRDYSHHIITLLNALGYKYKTGNNAPRQGKEGFYIECSKVAMNTLLLISKS